MKLIVCEKPSVAKEVARYLSAEWDSDWKCYSSKEYLVTNSIGHLMALDAHKMGFNTPPVSYFIKPEKFILYPVQSTHAQLEVISDLMNRSDVTEILSFTDNDVEGERIFWDIYDYSKVNKPVHRMWTSDVLSKKLIEELVTNPTDKDTYYPYREASKLRAYADLVMGLNCSSVYAFKKNRMGISLGRCQTPIFSEITKRFLENRDFVPTNTYKIGVSVKGVPISSNESYDSLEDGILDKLPKNVNYTVSEVETCTRSQFELYDKSSLIVDANRIYHIPASKVSEILQDLYQNKKITSYPRTPSRYLDEDIKTKMRIFKIIKDMGFEEPKEELLARGKSIFNNSKVKGHYALVILDGEKAKNYIDNNDNWTADVLKLLRTRMLTKASAPVTYLSKRLSFQFNIGDKVFTFELEGRKIVNEGWLKYDRSKVDTYQVNEWIFDLPESGILELTDGKIITVTSKPKPIYTSGSIIEWMKKNRIGTPATIDSYPILLQNRKYVTIDKSDRIIPTELGLSIYSDIKDLKISEVELTRDIEIILESIIDNHEMNGYEDHKDEVTNYINILFNNLRDSDIEPLTQDLTCECGSHDVAQEYLFLRCRACGKTVHRNLLSSKLTNDQMYKLLSGKTVWVTGMKSKRTGKRFNANVSITEKDGLKFHFK